MRISIFKADKASVPNLIGDLLIWNFMLLVEPAIVIGSVPKKVPEYPDQNPNTRLNQFGFTRFY